MPYSPWTDLGNSVQRASGGLNNSIGMLLRLKQQQSQQQQLMMLKEAQLAMQQRMQNSQIQRQQAAMGYDNSRVAHQQQIDQTSQQFGDAAAQYIPEPPIESHAMEMFPGASQGDYPALGTVQVPTQDGAMLAQHQKSQAELLRTRAMLAGLFGKVGDAFPAHNIAEGGVAVDPMTQQVVGMGMPKANHFQFHQGTQYGPPVLVNGDTGEVVPQEVPQGFNARQAPEPNAASLGNTLNQLIAASTGYQGTPNDIGNPNHPLYGLWSKGTNMLSQAMDSHIRAPQQASNVPSPRTQEEYDGLPSGTVYIDSDGLTKRKK